MRKFCDRPENRVTLMFILFVLLELALVVLPRTAYAGENCDAFYSGWHIGYCSVVYRNFSSCYSPRPPACYDSQFLTEHDAWSVGYELGREYAGAEEYQ